MDKDIWLIGSRCLFSCLTLICWHVPEFLSWIPGFLSRIFISFLLISAVTSALGSISCFLSLDYVQATALGPLAKQL